METNELNASVPEEQVSGGAPEAEDTNVAATETPAPAAEETGNKKEETVSGTETPAVDFADEEADLQASAPEFDLGENTPEEESGAEGTDRESGTTDFGNMNKTEIVDAFAESLRTKPVQTLRREAEAAKIAFYKAYRQEVDRMKKEFAATGGAPEEFAMPDNGDEERLKGLFAQYRKERDAYIARTEAEKEHNYRVKLGIIDELKELINSNETLNQTFTTFRELQNRWKEAGAVPQAHVKDLWETYHLHVENFYNFIKINNELRDLDLKKNAEAKIRLCEEAEALLLDPSAVSAFHQLQKLHEQWREVGPVGGEYKEQLWERFREASSKINKRHQEYFEALKEEQRRNLDLKTELCTKAEGLLEKAPASRKEWEKASDELIEIQKVWKTIGFAPKKDNTKIYERFRAACDRFFESKREFYAGLKSEMEANLQAKTALCEQAEALQDSEEWKKTTDALIALQKKWKETGPDARRHADAVWKRFRKACDTFFNRKAEHFSQMDDRYGENLERKRALLEEIRAFTFTDRESGFETLKDFQRRWAEIGFVPIREKDKLQAEYRRIIDEHFARLKGNDKERRIERFRDKISNLKEGKNARSLRYERERLYNKVKQLEADIALLENNIGFFAKSKNAESMIRDVNNKIAQTKEEMALTIDKINMIDKQSTEE